MVEKKLKLYAYVDESGQDPTSPYFVVVVIVIFAREREQYQRLVLAIEQKSKTYGLKWHKTRFARGLDFLHSVISEKLAKAHTYVGYFKKPIPYFLPIVDTLEGAIFDTASSTGYQTIVYIDGIDRKKALEITNALRSRGIRLKLVRSVRDESEPMIRLADMWAGLVRSSKIGDKDAQTLLRQADKMNHIITVAPKRPL